MSYCIVEMSTCCRQNRRILRWIYGLKISSPGIIFWHNSAKHNVLGLKSYRHFYRLISKNNRKWPRKSETSTIRQVSQPKRRGWLRRKIFVRDWARSRGAQSPENTKVAPLYWKMLKDSRSGRGQMLILQCKCSATMSPAKVEKNSCLWKEH